MVAVTRFPDEIVQLGQNDAARRSRGIEGLDAVSGRIDTLLGLKENVIVGRLIPAGTGGVVRRLREIAAQRDQDILSAESDAEDALESASDKVA